MKHLIDSLHAPELPPRVWRFRKRLPERVLLYVAPSPTIFSSRTKFFGFALTLLMGPAIAFTFSTNAVFSDTDHLSSQKIGTGEWIPDIHVDDSDGRLKLSSSLSTAKIYYKFSDDGDPRTDGRLFDGSCIKIPIGKKVSFEARAYHPDRDTWRSRVVSRKFSSSEKSVRDDEPDDCEKKDAGGKHLENQNQDAHRTDDGGEKIEKEEFKNLERDDDTADVPDTDISDIDHDLFEKPIGSETGLP